MVTVDRARAGISAAFARRGVALGANHIGARADAELIKFSMRLGRARNPLPTLEYIEQEVARGKVAPGSQEGAGYLLLGAIQTHGGEVRVTMRVVAVESGVILVASKADGAEASLDSVIDAAFAGLSTQFCPARAVA